MKKKLDKTEEIKDIESKDAMISRKEAIIKTGKYAAFTAASMMLVLSAKGGPSASGENFRSPRAPRSW